MHAVRLRLYFRIFCNRPWKPQERLAKLAGRVAVIKVGFKIVKRALEEPIRQIAENAGLDGAIIAEQARKERRRLWRGKNGMGWHDEIGCQGTVNSVYAGECCGLPRRWQRITFLLIEKSRPGFSGRFFWKFGLPNAVVQITWFTYPFNVIFILYVKLGWCYIQKTLCMEPA